VVRHEAHQVELAQHPHNGVALFHQHPVHPVPQHDQQGIKKFGIGRDSDQVEAGHLAHCQMSRRRGVQQRIAQVGGGEHANAFHPVVHIAHQRIACFLLRQQAAHRHQVELAVHIKRLLQVGVPHAHQHQRQQFAVLVHLFVVSQMARDLAEHLGAEAGIVGQQLPQGLRGQLPCLHRIERGHAGLVVPGQHSAPAEAFARAQNYARGPVPPAARDRCAAPDRQDGGSIWGRRMASPRW